MKNQACYIHGGESFSDTEAFLRRLQTKEIRNLPTLEQVVFWPTSLPEQLGETWSVFTPQMPNRENARYAEWKIWFERHFVYFEKEIVLIGWSLGAMFCVKYLSENVLPVKIKGLLLIAPSFDYFVDPETGEDGGDFNFDAHLIEQLAEQVGTIHIFHSKDDFVVPYEHGLKLNAALPKSVLHSFEDRNHFLQPEFPELLETLKALAT